MPASHDFFISYNRADRGWAEWIAWELETEGRTTFLHAWDFRPGGNWALDMQTGAQAQRTIAVLSPDYLEALYTQPEWAAAFAQDPTGERRTLLPVRVRKCEPKGLQKPIIYLDLVDLDEAAARAALLAGVNPGRAKPKTAPGFPGARPRTITEKPRFPGALPSIWNVPHRRNPNFSGREALLKSLRDALHSGQTAALMQAIAGLGGVGKTQLAIEYLYRHVTDYEIVWWIGAEQPVTLGSDYAALAGPLGLLERDDADQTRVVRAVRGELARRRDWLLIFDNAGAPEAVRDYLPQGGAGHTLITSRNPNWSSDARTINVRIWEPEEALRFLLERMERMGCPADVAAAAELAEALGDLPLALEQAAAYVEEKQIALAAYLRLFRAHQLRVFQSAPRPVSYEETVATTWQLAFEQVEEGPPLVAGAPLASKILNLCAFLAPDNIPRDLIRKWADFTDNLTFDEAVAALRKYSLMEVTPDTLSVHRLVQAVTRDRLTDADRKSWALIAASLVKEAFPFESEDVGTWRDYVPLLPHALEASVHAEALGMDPEAAGRLLDLVGLFLLVLPEFPDVKAAYERAFRNYEAAYGPDHPKVVTRLSNLGYILQGLGDLAGAKARYERALKIEEAAYGPDHPNVAIPLNHLGDVLQGMGDLAAAKAAYERALKIDQRFLGSDHSHTKRVQEKLNTVLKQLAEETP